ncbi:unnamed protein product [Linum tenue]|uniref:Uncharacterized protein n=1 Tax=Linum tenue TaxID=586396 RepID=A0AAV0R004_9ROSI|nr:unnamed protein product [Linum tenue]
MLALCVAQILQLTQNWAINSMERQSCGFFSNQSCRSWRLLEWGRFQSLLWRV